MSMYVSTLSFGIGYPLPLQSTDNSSLMLVTTHPAEMVAWNLIYKKRSHTEEILRRMSTPSLLVICSSVSWYIAEVRCCFRPLRMRSSPVSCGEKLRHLVAKEYRNCWMESWRDVVEGGGLGVRSSKGFSFSIQIMATVYFGQYEISYWIPTQYKYVLPMWNKTKLE